METGIADTGLTIGAGADHADVAAVLAASATDDENISTDGADGADADGTDTDIEVLDGERFKIETSVFSTAFKEAFKTDSLGTFTLTSVANSAASGDDATVNDHQLFKVDAKTGAQLQLFHTDEVMHQQQILIIQLQQTPGMRQQTWLQQRQTSWHLM